MKPHPDFTGRFFAAHSDYRDELFELVLFMIIVGSVGVLMYLYGPLP